MESNCPWLELTDAYDGERILTVNFHAIVYMAKSYVYSDLTANEKPSCTLVCFEGNMHVKVTETVAQILEKIYGPGYKV